MGMINAILRKAGQARGLSEPELIRLCSELDQKNVTEAMATAEHVRFKVIGSRAVFYTCLYITNKCENNCPYCGFRSDNKSLRRITLTPEQVILEAKAIADLGIKNIILIGGSANPEEYSDLILNSTKSLTAMGLNAWIEFENLGEDILKKLPGLGAKRFVLFQETYSGEYDRIHQHGKYKKSSSGRRQMIKKAVAAGFKEIGLGTLFGLDRDWKEEILGLYRHATELSGLGVKVSISFPRLTAAPGLPIKPSPELESILERAIVIMRLAIPEVSLALSGRERPGFRDKMFGVVDEIGSSGVPNPGGRTVYREYYDQGDTQFSLSDLRTPEDIRKVLKERAIQVN